jgi:hypothetical protein
MGDLAIFTDELRNVKFDEDELADLFSGTIPRDEAGTSSFLRRVELLCAALPGSDFLFDVDATGVLARTWLSCPFFRLLIFLG